MNHPEFFNEVPKISLYDPLAEFLGATADGILQYSYFDAVRLAGHSCPTVATAYQSTCKALVFLYKDATPVRGEIRVEFSQDRTIGVTGVIANVVSMLTGAMSDDGFKGIGDRFDRRKRLFFGLDMPCEMRFIRLDTGQAVQVVTNLKHVPASPRLPMLMTRCLSNTASVTESAEFRQLWQARVRSVLLEHGDNPDVFSVTPVLNKV